MVLHKSVLEVVLKFTVYRNFGVGSREGWGAAAVLRDQVYKVSIIGWEIYYVVRPMKCVFFTLPFSFSSYETHG